MTNACFPGCYPMGTGPQCVGPTTKPTIGYNNSCANGALATATAWINACNSYQSPGKPGYPIDPRCLKKPQDCCGGVLPYDKMFCQKRCPVAVGLAHKESLYCPTAISPDWNSQYPITGGTLGPPFSDGSGIDYGGGYGLWQLDGRNQNVQKLFVEQLEANGTPGCNTPGCLSCSETEHNDNSGCWYKEGFSDDRSGVPVWGYVAGFLTPARQKAFSEGKGREWLTPVKQAEWTLYQTSGDFGGSEPVIKLPGCDWSELRTCAGGPQQPTIWDVSDSNPDGSPAHIAATTGVEVCTQAMQLVNNVDIDNPDDWFKYKHCISDTGTIGGQCLDYKNISENG
jgi:hypothetical protein